MVGRVRGWAGAHQRGLEQRGDELVEGVALGERLHAFLPRPLAEPLLRLGQQLQHILRLVRLVCNPGDAFQASQTGGERCKDSRKTVRTILQKVSMVLRWLASRYCSVGRNEQVYASTLKPITTSGSPGKTLVTPAS